MVEAIVQEVPEPPFQRQPGQRAYTDRSQTVLSAFGWITYARTYYQAPDHPGVCPLDDTLGIIGGCTPQAARMLCRTAARSPYGEGCEDLLELAGLTVEPSFVQRLAVQVGTRGHGLLERLDVPTPPNAQTLYILVDGTGVPMAKEELQGRLGKGEDGQAKTREVKLAALFTQTVLDEEGYPVRDPASTTYLGTFESSDQFGPRVRQAALTRRMNQFKRQAFLGDGAPWVWTTAADYFPNALQILDLFHANEHVTDLAKLIYEDSSSANNMAVRWRALVYDSELEVMLQQARQDTPDDRAQAVDKALQYFEHNRHRMDYKTYRQEGYFIGSGVVEAGCKKLIGGRLKQSGMFWKERGGGAVVVLRCALGSSVTWDQFWKLFAELPEAA